MDYKSLETSVKRLATRSQILWVRRNESKPDVNSHSHENKSELDQITDGGHDVKTDNPHSVTASQILPGQEGQSGKFLKTNGSDVLWDNPTCDR